MADVEPVTASQVPASDTRGGHEASDVVDQDPNAQVEPDIAQGDAQPEPTLDGAAADADGDQAQEDVTKPDPASVAEVTKKADGTLPKRTTPAGKDKPTAVPVKSASGKVISLDKKASTLGAGNTKAASPGKPIATPSSPLSKTTASSSAKKPTTTSSANTTKTTMASRGSTSGPTPPSRRGSMVPPRAPSATGAPLPPKARTSTLFSSLTSSAPSKPLAEVNTTSRPSVVSPVGSVASLKSSAVAPSTVPPGRPRAAVSDAVRKTPSTARQSLPPVAVQPPQSRPIKPVGSISSIREVRDDGKALEDLQGKLREANESLAAKSDAVATLEAKVLQLESSLDEALVDARTKTSSIEKLQVSKHTLDAELSDLKARLKQLQGTHTRDKDSLHAVTEQFQKSEEVVASQAEDIRTLEGQVETLRADLDAAQENFESLRSSSDQSSAAAAAAAQMEREAFLRAKADVETITAEVNSLKAAHDRARQEAASRSRESQQREVEITALNAQLGQLKLEKEENAAKISELEVDILELRESQESTDDEHRRALDRLQRLETELTDAIVTSEQVQRDAEARDMESKQTAAEVALRHTDEVKLIKADLAKAICEVQALKTEIADAHAAHEETKAATQAADEARELEMEEAEQSYLSKHIELSEEIKRLTAELDSQEAKYAAKVDVVKAEHDQRLQAAFEQAKNEAGEMHGQDLQALRAESQATIEQLHAAHQSTMDDIRSELEATLQSQVSDLEKKLNTTLLELRATQDDLTKAKATSDALRAESEALRAQLENARADIVAASANGDQAADIERLNKEISNLRDENVMLNDVLVVTKQSLSEMSTNHSNELEETTRLRVEEVMRLRTIHDGEISTLAAQKSELALSLSDLEGEIAMLKAQLAAAESSVAPRSNGTVHASATMVTREELQKVHEAHNLKMHDLQAEHARAVRVLETEVETLQTRLDEVRQDVARKSMEIQYLEQEQEENQDSITRLKSDLEALKPTAS